MGILNDFFIATDEELASLDTRHGPWPAPASSKKRWWSRRAKAESALAEPSKPSLPIVDAKGVLDVELATLESILHSEPVDDVDAVVGLIQEALRAEPRKDPNAWIVPVNDRLVTGLVDAGSARIERLAAEWVETEEMQGWEAAEAADLLTQLGALFRQAREEGRGVYRWSAL